jgi:hypothetical protein
MCYKLRILCFILLVCASGINFNDSVTIVIIPCVYIFVEHNLQFPMSCLKRPLDGQDPDYEDTSPNEAKRLRLLEKNGNCVTVLSSSVTFFTVLYCFQSESDPINQKILCEAELKLRQTDTFISTEFVMNLKLHHIIHVILLA